MKVAEAYSILELSSTASPDDVKKRYRELTKKYHPDINKEPGAEDKFKKINEAYQVVTSGKSTDPMSGPAPSYNWNPFSGFGGTGAGWGNTKVVEIENIDLYTTISFMESVLGTKKEMKFNRRNKCQDCSGNGIRNVNNGCATCGGSGKLIDRNKGSVFIRTCSTCRGQVKTESCTTCASTGILETEASIHVSIPGGVINGTILRLSGMGNFAGNFLFGMDQYTDAFLHVTVLPEIGLTLENQDVISKLEISLLEALRGCTKSVKTIMGYRDIEINPKSRNREEIIIPKMGVNQVGNQRVILDVKYPQDINKLIEILSKEGIN